MGAFFKVLWPRGPYTWLGLILAVLSASAIVRFAIQHGFGPTCTLVLDYHERLASVLIASWSEPTIRDTLEALRRDFDWADVHLYPHWKHVFVLMGVYLFRHATVTLSEGLWVQGTIQILWATIVAVISSVLVGTVDLQYRDPSSQLLVGVVPIVGIFAYEVLVRALTATANRGEQVRGRVILTDRETWWSYFAYQVSVDFGRAIILSMVIGAVALVSHSDGLPVPGLIGLSVAVVLLAINWLREGAIVASRWRESGEEWGRGSWVEVFVQVPHAKLGLAMLRIVFWTGVFVLANAGLRLYGL